MESLANQKVYVYNGLIIESLWRYDSLDGPILLCADSFVKIYLKIEWLHWLIVMGRYVREMGYGTIIETEIEVCEWNGK